MGFEQYGIDIRGKTTGNVKTVCPKCGGKTDLSVNVTEGIWKCHKPKCGWTGSLHYQSRGAKTTQYVRPTAPVNHTPLDDDAVAWFKARGISQETLLLAKVTTGVEYMPQTKKEEKVIKFNYYKDGELVNIKFRTYK